MKQIEKIKNFAYISVAILGGGVILFLFFKYLFALLSPFFIAWTVAFATRPLAAFINRKTKIPTRPVRAILAILISVAALGIISLLVWLIASELWRFLGGIGEGGALRTIIDNIMSGAIFGGVPDKFGETLTNAFYNLLATLAATVGSYITAWISAVPKLLFFLLVTVIASVYFSLDLEGINTFAKRLVPKGIFSWLVKFKRGFFSVGLRYMKSYALLMFITFSIILIGLMILRQPYALILAFLIAFLDILPLLGAGAMLGAWGAYEIIFGNRTVGIGLVILLVINELIRQFAEPKIVGKNLGVHPIITLLLIYIGYSLFGFVGVFLVPIVTVLIDITLGKEDAPDVKQSVGSETDST